LRRRYRPDASPRSACAGRVGVTERTTRAEGPSEGRVPRKDREARWLRVGACACGATLTTFPSSAASEHSLSPVRAPPQEEPTTPDGPTKTHVLKGPREGYRLPAGRSAFDRARSRARSRIAPAWNPRRPPTHAVHTLRRACLIGHCRLRDEPELERAGSASAFTTDCSCLDLTTQARQFGSSAVRLAQG
jgi:hypothetical protein